MVARGEEGKGMSPNAQRIAIADLVPNWRPSHGGKYCTTIKRSLDDPSSLPGIFDPLSELNAMHEAENFLSDDQWRIFKDELRDAVFRDYERNQERGEWMRYEHATAAQRAEAFLRTLSKWDDAK